MSDTVKIILGGIAGVLVTPLVFLIISIAMAIF